MLHPQAQTTGFRCLYIILLLLICGCGKVTTVTQAEVEQRIQRQLQLGATPKQVVAFLNSSNFGGLKAQHNGYIPDTPPSLQPFEGPAIEKGGHISATIPMAARDPRRFLVYRINIDFRFDSANRLAEYNLQTQGDW